MNRRNFILGAISVVLSNVSFSKSPLKNISIYIDESGGMGTEYPFVIGMLIVDDSYNFNRIRNIRNESGFNLTLKHSSLNKYKMCLYRPIIKEFFHQDELKYSAMVFNGFNNSKWPSNKNERNLEYRYSYQSLILDNMNKYNSITLYLEGRKSSGKDTSLKSWLEVKVEKLTVKFIHSYESDFIQLCDVLTGSIYRELNGDLSENIKSEILDDLRGRVGQSKLSDNFNYNNGKFRVYHKTL